MIRRVHRPDVEHLESGVIGLFGLLVFVSASGLAELAMAP
jgi:hypothetical protein